MAPPSPQLDALLTSEAPEHAPDSGKSPRRSFRSRISDSFQRVRGRSPSPSLQRSPSPSVNASPNTSPSKKLDVRKFIQRSLSPSREPRAPPRGAYLETTQYYVPEQISDWLLYDGSQVRASDLAGPPQLANPGASTMAPLSVSKGDANAGMHTDHFAPGPDHASGAGLEPGEYMHHGAHPGEVFHTHAGVEEPTHAAWGAEGDAHAAWNADAPAHMEAPTWSAEPPAHMEAPTWSAEPPAHTAAAWDAEPQHNSLQVDLGGPNAYAGAHMHENPHAATTDMAGQFVDTPANHVDEANVRLSMHQELPPLPDEQDNTIIDNRRRSRIGSDGTRAHREWNHGDEENDHEIELAAAQDDAWRAASPDLTRSNRTSQYSDRPGSRASNSSGSNKQQGILSAMMRAPEGAGLTELMNRVAPPAGHKWLRGIWSGSTPQEQERNASGSSHGSSEGVIFRGADVSPSLYSNDTERFPDNESEAAEKEPDRGPSRVSHASRTNTISSRASTVTRHSDDEREAFERKRRSMLQARNILEQERRSGMSSDFRRISGESRTSKRYSVVPYKDDHVQALEPEQPPVAADTSALSEAEQYAREYQSQTQEHVPHEIQYAYDEHGNQYQYDEHGNLFTFDEHGNKYVFDQRGYQYVYDMQGNMFVYDQHGNQCAPPDATYHADAPMHPAEAQMAPAEAQMQSVPQATVEHENQAPHIRRKAPPTEAELASRRAAAQPEPTPVIESTQVAVPSAPPSPAPQPAAIPLRSPTKVEAMLEPGSPEAPPGMRPDGFGGFVPLFDEDEDHIRRPNSPVKTAPAPAPAPTQAAAHTAVGPVRTPTIVRREEGRARVPSMRRSTLQAPAGPARGVSFREPAKPAHTARAPQRHSLAHPSQASRDEPSFTVAAEVYTTPHALAAGQHTAWTRDMANSLASAAARNGPGGLDIPPADTSVDLVARKVSKGGMVLGAPTEPVTRSRSVLEQLHARGADVMLDAGEGIQPKDMPLSNALQEIMVRFYSYERFSIPVLRELDNRLVGLEHWVLTQNGTDKWTEESVARVTSEMRREMRTMMHGVKEIHEARIAVQNIAESSSRKRKHSGDHVDNGKRIASGSSVRSDSSTSTVVMTSESKEAAQPTETPAERPDEPAALLASAPHATPPRTALAPEPSPLSRLARTLSNRSQAQAREQEQREREEAERKAREEAERKAKEEAERKAQEEAERKAQEEAERKAREEAERKAQEEAERKVKEAERKAQEEAERQAKEAEERVRRAVEERFAAERAKFEQQLEQERLERERLEREVAKRAATRNISPPPAPPVLIGARTSPSHAVLAREATGTVPASSSQREVAMLNGGIPAVPTQRPRTNENASTGLRARAQRYLEHTNGAQTQSDENRPIETKPAEHPVQQDTLAKPKAPAYSPSPLSESLRRRIALFENQQN
ncbi:hypothetical protein MCUN1_001013 [Malassezia cuniculi]|uniref:Uncharacterized protein n=1 Tax=Malassezia cuniculi TaxID=948313 RepID=A0AAF0EPH0_9BASI|nr:hypothetical protein MCUN1_001013 [Malassezia cuniculi]